MKAVHWAAAVEGDKDLWISDPLSHLIQVGDTDQCATTNVYTKQTQQQ